MIKICLDAGHWGKYNRSPGVKAYYESDMAWKLHLFQKKFLEEYEGVSVITTRTDQGTDKALFDRGMTSKGCDLFLSDHSNAVGSGMNESVDYVAVYHLVDDTTTEIDDISKRIAEQLAPVIAGVMGTKQGFRLVTRKSGNDRNGDGMLNDNYYGVLHGARMAETPGLILEHSFHTNTRMTNWLLDDGNLARLAQAEADAIAAYYGLVKKGHTGGNVTAPAQGSTGSNEELIWKFLKSKGLNDYAVAGIWGNLKKNAGSVLIISKIPMKRNMAFLMQNTPLPLIPGLMETLSMIQPGMVWHNGHFGAGKKPCMTGQRRPACPSVI